jgi:hypothetical protein
MHWPDAYNLGLSPRAVSILDELSKAINNA